MVQAKKPSHATVPLSDFLTTAFVPLVHGKFGPFLKNIGRSICTFSLLYSY